MTKPGQYCCLIMLALLGLGCTSPEGAPVVITPAVVELSPTPLDQQIEIKPSENPLPEPSSAPTSAPTPIPEIDLNRLRIELRLVASGLSDPVGLVHAGDGSGRLFVVERFGTIKVISDGRVLPVPFLDIAGRVNTDASERGLLGLAFNPRYKDNGYFYINYTDSNGDTRISRYSVTGDPNTADPGSEQVLLLIDQPAANHNGGNLVFGPDGYLYIGLGDGGRAGDVFGNAQNGQTLLGAMLRIDVGSGDPYGIPADNPFLNDPGVRDEIWAIGLRNPWRYSFDRLTGDLYLADVGQNTYEEVNVQPASSTGGENYGWPIMEGQHCYQSETCSSAGYVSPVVEYSHAQGGCSITGGYVYRGPSYPAIFGVYFFGDFCSGLLWGLAPVNGEWHVRQLATTGLSISSFGEGEDGEVYVVDIHGSIYQIAAS